MQIENKVFIVTGGASGLGAATAQMLVKAGAKVMLVDLNAEAVAAQALALGDQARSAVADISQADAAQAAVAATVAAFGTVNGLVNCAGIVRGEKILGKNGPQGRCWAFGPQGAQPGPAHGDGADAQSRIPRLALQRGA